MTHPGTQERTLLVLDDATRALVRLSAAVTAGTEAEQRVALVLASQTVPAIWAEELLLQSYLFAGFPRALNAMREWRRVRAGTTPTGAAAPSDASVPSAPAPATTTADSAVGGGVDLGADLDAWRDAGERTCATVYGSAYERLRVNIRHLHPLLDEWMIVEGYGKVLSRPGLDLARRELCIVAACAAAGQDRQLHSHLHGARNAGVPAKVITSVLDALDGLVPADRVSTARLLWLRVRGK